MPNSMCNACPIAAALVGQLNLTRDLIQDMRTYPETCAGDMLDAYAPDVAGQLIDAALAYLGVGHDDE